MEPPPDLALLDGAELAAAAAAATAGVELPPAAAEADVELPPAAAKADVELPPAVAAEDVELSSASELRCEPASLMSESALWVGRVQKIESVQANWVRRTLDRCLWEIIRRKFYE